MRLLLSLLLLSLGLCTLSSPSSLLDNLLQQIQLGPITLSATFLLVPIHLSLNDTRFAYFQLDEKNLSLSTADDTLSVAAKGVNVSMITSLLLKTPLSSSASQLSLSLNEAQLRLKVKGSFDPGFKG